METGRSPEAISSHILECVSANDRLGALFLDANNATEVSVKKAYHKLSKIIHPDKNNGNQECSEAFLALKKCADELQTAGELEKEIAKKKFGFSGDSMAHDILSSSGGVKRTWMQATGARMYMPCEMAAATYSSPAYTTSGSTITTTDIFGHGCKRPPSSSPLPQKRSPSSTANRQRRNVGGSGRGRGSGSTARGRGRGRGVGVARGRNGTPANTGASVTPKQDSNMHTVGIGSRNVVNNMWSSTRSSAIPASSPQTQCNNTNPAMSCRQASGLSFVYVNPLWAQMLASGCAFSTKNGATM